MLFHPRQWQQDIGIAEKTSQRSNQGRRADQIEFYRRHDSSHQRSHAKGL